MRESAVRRGVAFGLAAAVSFGVSAPLAKSLLGDVEPQLMAGLLYVGAFVALSMVPRGRAEAPLRRADAPRLAALIVFGGVFAPVCLLLGLERVSGVTGSLLLNLEAPFTMAVGVVMFREHLPRQSMLGALVIFVGAVLLGSGAGSARADWLGIALIAIACGAWALDNNLTQSLTIRDPRAIVRVKTGVAGATNVALAVALGVSVPALGAVAAVLALGAVSYGLSVYLDVLALRLLGAAREAAIFAVAPFAGALLAPLVLPETFGTRELTAGAVMAVGVVLLVREHHDHVHRHDPLHHEHVHDHDAHHEHAHAPGVLLDGPHSHPHQHDALEHAHPHVSDVHHRHPHGRRGKPAI